jgi:hypothetical protein
MRKVLMAAAALALTAPLAPALAHDDDDYGYRGYSTHSRFHDELEEAHERAHEEGFYSPEEHRAFHRALRYLHHEYHEDNPYPNYRPYYYRPGYYYRRPGVSFYFGF